MNIELILLLVSYAVLFVMPLEVWKLMEKEASKLKDNISILKQRLTKMHEITLKTKKKIADQLLDLGKI